MRRTAAYDETMILGLASPVRLAVAVVCSTLLIGVAVAQSPAPEAPSGRTDKQAVTAKQFMIAAANPHAAEAGFQMLKQGGSAVDATIAAQLVLGLVEPQSSGIGGGAFMLHWDGRRRVLASYDGREKAPARAGPDLFLGDDGNPLKFWAAVVGGRSVGVPGLVRMMEMAHRRHGRLPWEKLFEPAIKLAEEGFAVSPRLNALVANDKYLKTYPEAAAYFYDGAGNPRPVGFVLKNPGYADVLARLAVAGGDGFYTGPIARDIVKAVRGVPDNPGLMTLSDLAKYEAKARPPVCGTFRRHSICGMGPPTSGGLTVAMILGQLDRFDLASLGPRSPEAWHLFAESARLAYADRGLYMADSDFVDVPTEGLIDPNYLVRRSKQIRRRQSIGKAEPGTPDQKRAGLYGPDDALELPSTSHISVVDADGNAVSMTTSIESGFGSRVMVNGFLLNNQLTDFSFRAERDGKPVANRVEPGKRPRSSMSPTIVFDPDGNLRAVLGSPGGSRIINYVAKTVVAMIDWELDAQEAVNLGHVVNRNGGTDLEEGTGAETLMTDLGSRGHELNIRPLTSGLHVIEILPDGTLRGGADPRREGVALGE